MVSPEERGILEAVAHGRNSLDHFVDRLGLDCATVRCLAESLVERGYLRRLGTWFGAGLSYELTNEGDSVLGARPAEGALREARVTVTDLVLLRKLMQGPLARATLLEEAHATAAASQLSHLQDVGYINVTGLFRGRVALTAKGRRLLETCRELVDSCCEEAAG